MCSIITASGKPEDVTKKLDFLVAVFGDATLAEVANIKHDLNFLIKYRKTTKKEKKQ